MILWSEEQKHLDFLLPSQLIPVEVFYEYDYPLIFSADIGFERFLFYRLKEIDGGDIFLSVPLSSELEAALRENRISVRGALGDQPCRVHKVDYTWKIEKTWNSNTRCFKEEQLPRSGVGIIRSVDRVPDTLPTVEPFIKFKFTGQGLGEGSVPFQVFKKYVNSVYDFVRSALAPDGMEGARSDAFDFFVREPRFASLEIAIDKPVSDVEKVRKYLSRETMSEQDLSEGFFHQRQEMFVGLESLVEEVGAGRVKKSTLLSSKKILREILAILPDHDNSVAAVEISAKFSGIEHSIYISDEIAKEIREAHAVAFTKRKKMKGRISIINKNSASFVIESVRGGQMTTCELEREMFDALVKNTKFKIGAMIEVSGDWTPRPRRGKMAVSSSPTLLA